MNKHDWKVLGEYLKWCANEMELRDWTLILDHSPPPQEDANAYIRLTYGRKHAIIHVAKDFRQLRKEEQRSAIAHELTHCHFESCANMVQNDLEKHLGATGDQLFFDAWKRQYEYGVDAIASVVAKQLPYIKWDSK